MNVSELMNRTLVSVRPDTSLIDAVKMMLEHRISGLPVLDENNALVGMITEGDLLRREEIGTAGSPAGWFKSLFQPASVAADYVTTHARHVGGVMTRDPVYISPKTTLTDAAHLMLEKHFKRLPVLDNGKLVGMLGRSDMIRELINKLSQTPFETRSDDQIKAALNMEIEKAKWAPKSGITLAVEDGIVTLGGTIFSDEERRGVITLTENTPGVKKVIDQMVFIDPGSGLAFPTSGVGI